jgi:hypothetical protein
MSALGSLFGNALATAREHGVSTADAELQARRVARLEEERRSLPGNTQQAVANCEEALKQARGRGDEPGIVAAATALAAAREAHAALVGQREAVSAEIRKGVVLAYHCAGRELFCAAQLIGSRLQAMTKDPVYLEVPELVEKHREAIEQAWRELVNLVAQHHALGSTHPAPDLRVIFQEAVPAPVQPYVAEMLGIGMPRGLRRMTA